jgi:hypothetical protein
MRHFKSYDIQRKKSDHKGGDLRNKNKKNFYYEEKLEDKIVEDRNITQQKKHYFE